MQKNVDKFGISDKRGRARTSKDPYIPEEGRKEETICTDCKAIYRDKHWFLDNELFEKLDGDGSVNRTTCPACRKIADRYPEGIVTLRGGYLWDHETEIRNIISNEEEKAMAKNPLERIMTMEREGDAMIIETTEQKLAEHLGRALNKAHQGELDISWAKDHAVCRVTWERPA
ncbi:MAG: hypothetical protein GWN87_26440 [Desulfuromonadales bacterium]|nr:hypothetical protein [Desulfuromonadales bacterium]NIS43289.1 hypothetical protein [Desulfuromonadales bacterium]